MFGILLAYYLTMRNLLDFVQQIAICGGRIIVKDKKDGGNKAATGMTLGMAIGMSLGTAIGAATGNIRNPADYWSS